MATADDPASFAASNRLYYVDGKARVVVELQAQNADLPAGYNITVEGRQGAMAQALVPIRDLCRLSNEPQVRFVRAPLEPVR